MTDREQLYRGATCAAWGYFFLYVDINLFGLNVLPNFAAYWLFLSAIRHLSAQRRDLELLRPLGGFLLVWSLADWCAPILNTTLDGRVPILDALVAAAGLYFHFQLFTDCAALAAAHEPEGGGLEKRFLRWRTVHAVTQTAAMLLAAADRWVQKPWTVLMAGLAVVIIVTAFCLMGCMFALRKLFQEEPEPPEAAELP